MDQFKKTKNAIIFMTILVIVAVVAYVMFFVSIKNKNENVSLITNEIDIAVEKEVKLKSVKNLVNDIEEDRLKLDTYFIKDDEVVDFIESVEGMAEDADISAEVTAVDIGDYKNNVNQASDMVERLLLSLKVYGKWNDVFHFISLIEKMPFVVNLSNINIGAVYSNNKKTSYWQGTFKMSALKLKEEDKQ
jgi:Tfp pilus assembly protein PilO